MNSRIVSICCKAVGIRRAKLFHLRWLPTNWSQSLAPGWTKGALAHLLGALKVSSLADGACCALPSNGKSLSDIIQHASFVVAIGRCGYCGQFDAEPVECTNRRPLYIFHANKQRRVFHPRRNINFTFAFLERTRAPPGTVLKTNVFEYCPTSCHTSMISCWIKLINTCEKPPLFRSILFLSIKRFRSNKLSKWSVCQHWSHIKFIDPKNIFNVTERNSFTFDVYEIVEL